MFCFIYLLLTYSPVSIDLLTCVPCFIWFFCLLRHLHVKFFFFTSSAPEVFIDKDILKICSKFTGELLCRSVISIKLLCNYVEITLRHECCPVNLLHVFRTASVFFLYICFRFWEVLFKRTPTWIEYLFLGKRKKWIHFDYL